MSPTSRARRSVTGKRGRNKPVMPFSLILPENELTALRRIAERRGTSVAAVIRMVLHKVIFQAHPDLAVKMIESDIDRFFETVKEKLPGRGPSQAVKARLKKQLVRGLLRN